MAGSHLDGGSEGQGLPLFVGAAVTNYQGQGGLNSECLFLNVVELEV